MIHVFLVASRASDRAAREALRRANPSLEIVGSASDWVAFEEHPAAGDAEVVLADLSGEDLKAFLDTYASSPAIDARVVVLTDDANAGSATEALRSGARAVLPRDAPPGKVSAAIVAAAAGLTVVDADETAALFPTRAQRAVSPLDERAEPLTPREREVLRMMAGGLSNKEIASRLAISAHTAKFHVASILGKLAASSRAEAVSIGFRQGLILF